MCLGCRAEGWVGFAGGKKLVDTNANDTFAFLTRIFVRI